MSTRSVLHPRLRCTALRLTAFLVGAAAMIWTGGNSQAETWTDLSGARTVEGKMVGMWGDRVILELNDGRRVGVGMNDLQAESRIQAQKLSEQIGSRRSERVDELQAQAQVAAAPAPDPLPQPQPAPEYEKPAADMSVVESHQQMMDQLRAGHLIVFFDSMPPSYRQDTEALVKQAVAKVDPAAWQAVTDAIHQVGELIVTRQNWIFSHPRFAAVPPETTESLKQFILPIAGILRDGFDPEATRLEDLRTKPLRQWLAERDQAISPHVFALAERFSGQLPAPQVEVEKEQDGSATVKLTQAGTTQTLVVKKIEGFWVTADQAESWEKMVEDAKKRLEPIPDGSLGSSVAQMLPGMLQSALEPLKTADSAAEFHAAMNALIQSAGPAMQMAASMGGGELNLRFNQQSGGGAMQGYGQEMQGYEQQMQMRQQQYYGESGSEQGNGDPGADEYEEQMRRQQQRMQQQGSSQPQ